LFKDEISIQNINKIIEITHLHGTIFNLKKCIGTGLWKAHDNCPNIKENENTLSEREIFTGNFPIFFKRA